MVGTIKTKNTRLYFAVSASEIHFVNCATGIQGLGGPATRIDETCLDSPEMEYSQGLRDPGQVNVPINFKPGSASHQALIALAESGDEISFMIVGSDQYPGAPTSVDSDGRLVSPGASTAEFIAYVADIEVDIQTNEIWRGTVQLQRSGSVVWDLPSASLP